MLIHLIPKLYTPIAVDVRLVDVSIPEICLTLDGSKDLMIRRPYPNKRYWVACRKTGRRSISGVLVEITKPISAYTVTTRWAVNADMLLTHTVEHHLLDNDFDAVSDDMTLWDGTSDGRYTSRWPSIYDDAPVKLQPAMDLFPAANGGLQRPLDTHDELSVCGFIQNRLERFRLPTIDRERLFDNEWALHPLPALNHVFAATATTERN